ncbi:hypothetical protein [Mycobacterium mantenii]|uniref:SHOCT domain-containing protein n=1 Tax=Mycobacterium mantenii TaxID=560555 RepID=A0A1A2SVU0_MYCNT|nr:hypothetical protein [Mycobacterium mantenii]OBH48027.1 hypothetical protein A5688_25040 [Mycobacterium mantenii]OBH68264.1 hypothetical protein A5683_07625 [Mycobacterium mantenii]
MKGKVIVLGAGVVVSLFLVARYFALSRAGVPLGWMLYLGLPVTGAGVLFALRLLELGDGWGAGVDTLRHRDFPDAPPSASERLRDLENLYVHGAISDLEYRARRLKIISGG